MRLAINRDSPVGLGDQIVSQLSVLIISGELEPNTALPTAKQLAVDIAVNPNTVAAAYRELERQGYVVSRKRAGTQVAAKPPAHPAKTVMTNLGAQLAEQAKVHGLDHFELLRLVAAQLSLGAKAPQYRVAVLARAATRGAELAVVAGALLGDGFECVPQGLEQYDSSRYHLTLIDPELTSVFEKPAEQPAPLPHYLQYSPDFPAAAD